MRNPRRDRGRGPKAPVSRRGRRRYSIAGLREKAELFGIRQRNEAGVPGAGTDRTRDWIEGGPVIVLVEPQLGENIGATARAMANFGLTRLRLVKPRDGWPSAQARRSASGADRVIDEAALFDTLEAAIADCTYVLATTARDHHQAKPVDRRRRCGGGDGAQNCRRRDGRRGVRARAQRARERRGRARRQDRDAAGESGVRLAQSRPGGAPDRL